jgi:hypothetical protein
MNALDVIDYLESGLSLGDVRRLDDDQLSRFKQAAYHWEQLATWELRKRTRLAKEEEAE